MLKVKSYFSSLVGGESSRFPWKSVWRTQAPSWAAFFAWSAALEKILTTDNLGSERSSLWIDATCAKETGKLWTTFFLIVM
jgi:hypothetical protein